MSEDFVCDIIQIMDKVLTSVSETEKETFERDVRKIYGGSRVYIKKYPANLRQRIRQQFTGNNYSRVANALGVSPQTVRRATKKRPATSCICSGPGELTD